MIDVITLQEALTELYTTRQTISTYIRKGLLTPSRQDELRDGCTREILHIVKDEKYNDLLIKFTHLCRNPEGCDSRVFVQESDSEDIYCKKCLRSILPIYRLSELKKKAMYRNIKRKARIGLITIEKQD